MSGPKATRLRRVMSVSDGAVEVGWVPVHSAPEISDRPFVTLSTISQVHGKPNFRINFTPSEARELMESLAFVLEAEIPAETFKDEVDGYTQAVRAAYPTRSGSHDEYAPKMQILAGRCDGAVVEDGAGFSKFDAGIGHALAECKSFSPKQALCARKLAVKYRRQTRQPELVMNTYVAANVAVFNAAYAGALGEIMVSRPELTHSWVSHGIAEAVDTALATLARPLSDFEVYSIESWAAHIVKQIPLNLEREDVAAVGKPEFWRERAEHFARVLQTAMSGVFRD